MEVMYAGKKEKVGNRWAYDLREPREHIISGSAYDDPEICRSCGKAHRACSPAPRALGPPLETQAEDPRPTSLFSGRVDLLCLGCGGCAIVRGGRRCLRGHRSGSRRRPLRHRPRPQGRRRHAGMIFPSPRACSPRGPCSRPPRTAARCLHVLIFSLSLCSYHDVLARCLSTPSHPVSSPLQGPRTPSGVRGQSSDRRGS